VTGKPGQLPRGHWLAAAAVATTRQLAGSSGSSNNSSSRQGVLGAGLQQQAASATGGGLLLRGSLAGRDECLAQNPNVLLRWMLSSLLASVHVQGISGHSQHNRIGPHTPGLVMLFFNCIAGVGGRGLLSLAAPGHLLQGKQLDEHRLVGPAPAQAAAAGGFVAWLKRDIPVLLLQETCNTSVEVREGFEHNQQQHMVKNHCTTTQSAGPSCQLPHIQAQLHLTVLAVLWWKSYPGCCPHSARVVDYRRPSCGTCCQLARCEGGSSEQRGSRAAAAWWWARSSAGEGR